MPPKIPPKIWASALMDAACACAATAAKSILAAGVLLGDAVKDALDVILSVGVTLAVTVVLGVSVELGVAVLEGVFEAVEPVEREGVGVGVDVGVAVPLGLGVAAATSEKVVGEVSV